MVSRADRRPISGVLVSLLAVVAVAAFATEVAAANATAAVAFAAALQVMSLRAPPFEHLQYTSAYASRFHSDERNIRIPGQPEVSGSSAPFSVDLESE